MTHTQTQGADGAGTFDHEFKSAPSVFYPAARGEKMFEYRRDDRGGYQVGQTVRLRCYDAGSASYLPEPPLERRITNILRGGDFELPQGYCILSLAPLASPAPAEGADDAGTEWFWRIVDANGLGNVPSDETEALRLLCTKAAWYDEARSAPAATPGVPDSLREAFAAATDSPVFVHDFADPAVSSAPGCQDVSLSFVTPDHITAAFMGNGLAGTIDQARKDAVALAAAWNHVRALIAAQPAGQSEPPILRVVVEVYPDRTDTRLTFGDRIRPEPGVKAVEQAISALQAEFDGRNGCPAIKSSKRSPQETWISVSALQPQQKAMLGRWSQGAPNEDGSPHFYWQQCSGRYFDFQGERHWCLDGHRFEGAPFYGESPTHALIIAEPPPHGSWGNQVGQSEDDVERCIACDKPLKAGELVLPDAEGGTIHTACCGPERESYTGADGGPLGPNDPIPQGYVYEGEQPARQEGHDRKWVCNGDPTQPAGQAGDAGAETERLREAVSKALHDNQFLDGWPEMVDPVVEAVLAARPEAPSDAGWVKINDEARNGAHWLVARPGSKPIRAYFEGGRWWMHGAGRWSRRPADLTGAFEPTHYQPLPTAPSDPAPSGQAEG